MNFKISFIATAFITMMLVPCKTLYASSAEVKLGKAIFFDTNLSAPVGQSCASCHRPEKAYADPDQATSPGAITALTGNRNTPSITYSAYTAKWNFNAEDETWIGGFFHDGREKTMLSQATGPLLNPLEMGNSSIDEIITKIRKAKYSNDFKNIYGADIFEKPAQAIQKVAQALVTFQKSEQFAPRFTSKYDAYLKQAIKLTDQELRGLELFEEESKGNCAACHPSKVDEFGRPPLFTDFSYDNLGVPANKDLRYYHLPQKFNAAGIDYIDIGLAENPNIKTPSTQRGKFKVPTLRNIALTAPYMHNGVFKTLDEAVEFYNTRDKNDKWGKPEVSENVNQDELGDLELTEQELKDIVAFLKTLNDGWQPE